MTAPRQLSLSVNLNDEATFDNFYFSDQSTSAQVVELLRCGLLEGTEPFVYLWGAEGAGLTHLLQATCQQGMQAQYLPLQDMLAYPPQQLLENLEQMDLICLDNIHAVAGNTEWEQGLFDLYNRVREQGHRLLVSGNCAPRELTLKLPDLQSRLGWGPVYQLPSLADGDKADIIQFRAGRRGMQLADEVARYLVNHAPRNMGALMAGLETLERASLEEKRKLTIPFLKTIFNW